MGPLWSWVLLLTLVAGCASMAPEKPISSFDAIAGEWVGTVYFQGGARDVQLTINKDGSYSATSSMGSSVGRFTLVNGKVIGKNETTGAESEGSLREKGAEQILVSTGKTPAGVTYATEYRRKR